MPKITSSTVRAALLGAVVALGGCASATLPLYEKLYRKDLSTPDTGERIDAGDGVALSYSLTNMVKGLEPLERERVVRSAVGLALYQGCLDFGRYTIKARDPMMGANLTHGWIRPEDCDDKAGRFESAVSSVMSSFQRHGRPDGAVVRSTRMLAGGPTRTRGHGNTESWQHFHTFGAHALGGMTRTQMMNGYADLLAGF